MAPIDNVTGPAYIYRATLHRVIDGDTYELLVDLGFRVYSRLVIRLVGYSAPETHEVGGPEATARALALLAGENLLIRSHKSKSGADLQSFARWLAEIWVEHPKGQWVSVAATLEAN